MCRKYKVDCSFIKLVTLFLPLDSMTKLTILSTVRHLKYSMKHNHLGMEFKRHMESITNVQFPSNFLRMSPKMYF